MKSLVDLSDELFNTRLTYKRFKMFPLLQVTIGDYYCDILRKFHIINLIKRCGLEGLIKYASFRAKHLFLSRRPVLSFDCLFINEVNNKPTLESFHAVYKQFADVKAGMVFSDPRLGKRGPSTINIFEFSTLGVLFSSFFAVIGFIPSIIRHWNELTFVKRKYGVSRAFVIVNFFDSIFMINIVEAMFNKVTTPRVVLMSDVHKLSRTITLKAAELGIPTFVLQHGATVGEAGYLPVTADRMLVWGEGSRNWFIERAQPPEKIVVVGSPRMDMVTYHDLTDAHRKPDRLKKVLVIMSEVTLETDFLETVRDGFLKAGMTSTEISVKLHPGGAVDYSYIPQGVFQGSGLSTRILRFEPLQEVLTTTDAVIVTTSSVGMETIIRNKPLLQFKSALIHNHRMSYEDFDCSHVFRTPEDLASVIVNPEIVVSKLGNYARFVEFYFGKLDGGSSLRAKEYIMMSEVRK